MADSPQQSSQPELLRELGLRDVTFFAIACIVGVRWITSAAHAGAGSVTLWVIAAVFFLAPLAFTVGTLSAKYPGSGGLYTMARIPVFLDLLAGPGVLVSYGRAVLHERVRVHAGSELRTSGR
jgi:hypothetical protein